MKSAPSHWMFVLAAKEPAEWVIAHGVMGFREGVRLPAMRPGDCVVLYLTRGVRRNPTRDRARIAGVGRLTSGLSSKSQLIAGSRYPRSCTFGLDHRFNLADGPEFAPLVGELAFIENKGAWSAYLRRTVVRITDDDFQLISSVCDQAVRRTTGG